MSYEMVTKMEFLDGNVTFHQHPVAPSFKFLKAGGMFSVFRDGSDLHMKRGGTSFAVVILARILTPIR